MKQIEDLLTLNNKEFAWHMADAEQDSFYIAFENNKELKNLFIQKSCEIFDELLTNVHRPNLKFAESSVLVSLLPKHTQNRLFFYSLVHNENFIAVYNCYNLWATINEEQKELLPRVICQELNRLADCEIFHHLENNINHLEFLKSFQPLLSENLFPLIVYGCFIHHIKNGMRLNNENYLYQVGLEDTNSRISFKEIYLTKTYTLIDNFKEYLGFKDWNDELINKFHKDVQTPNPYNTRGMSSWDYEIKSFEPYAKFLNKLILKNKMVEELKIKNSSTKSVKI